MRQMLLLNRGWNIQMVMLVCNADSQWMDILGTELFLLCDAIVTMLLSPSS